MSFDLQQSAYTALRSIITERTRRVIVWTGAGLSASAGVPTWADLRERLTTELESKAKGLKTSDRATLEALAQNARKSKSPWDAFKVLKQGLGETTYRETIKGALNSSQVAGPPAGYEHLWRLEVQGIINLNIDKLASRAFAEVHGGKRTFSEFNSKDVGDHAHVLNSPRTPFIYNAHGVEDDFNSWVFTKPELTSLLSREAYLTFIRSVFTAFTVVFIGISADDRAAGGHLEALKQMGITTDTHYWITERRDGLTDRWAEEQGIRPIRYANADGKHAELDEMFEDLLSFLPTAEPIDPVPVAPIKHITANEVLPSPADLVLEEPEMIRLFLNSHAQHLLEVESDESYEAYMKFVREYDRAIWNAWYVTLTGPDSVVLGYQIVRDEARGAFGRVYQATDGEGRPVAVKILLQEIQKDQEALVSFRRGVGSMRILKARGVKGMVEYLEAAEIPAMVVMEWVDGENLRAAVDSKAISEWRDILKVGVELSAILREAHSLPERVLHRDVRPANIMLDGLHRGRPWTVKVLDFDLSWHKGAYDRTLVHSAGTTGYLAPEQLQRIDGVSTRHSAVDSFGLGMTLFFLIAARDPFPDQHKHHDWRQSVVDAAAIKPCKWESLPTRFARLVLAATDDRQSQRPDMTAMNLELARLVVAIEGGRVPLDLLVEEIACRSETFEGYEWSDDQAAATIVRPSGISAEFRANESRNRLTLTFRRMVQDVKKGIGKKQAVALAEVRQALNQPGWKLDQHQAYNLDLNLVAHISPDVARAKLDGVVALIDKVSRIIRFDY